MRPVTPVQVRGNPVRQIDLFLIAQQVHLTAPRDTAREAEEPAEILLRPLQMEEQVNPLERDHVLAVVLPGGLEKNATVHGRWVALNVCVFQHLHRFICLFVFYLSLYSQYLHISSHFIFS